MHTHNFVPALVYVIVSGSSSQFRLTLMILYMYGITRWPPIFGRRKGHKPTCGKLFLSGHSDHKIYHHESHFLHYRVAAHAQAYKIVGIYDQSSWLAWCQPSQAHLQRVDLILGVRIVTRALSNTGEWCRDGMGDPRISNTGCRIWLCADGWLVASEDASLAPFLH